MQKFFIDFCDIKKIGGQFGTRPNLAPDPIWHRTQFGTGPIWHQECKRVNLAPDPIWHQECKRVNLAPRVQKESIWHRTQFGTKSVKGVNLAPDPIWHRTQFGTELNLAPRV